FFFGFCCFVGFVCFVLFWFVFGGLWCGLLVGVCVLFGVGIGAYDLCYEFAVEGSVYRVRRMCSAFNHLCMNGLSLLFVWK
ncbi:hypothetical protein, partial [Pseudomonas syringae group genomosp. 7]|uniref:hypothetical protein n=1 Tax=Pseudomonas syringae group genomosp. 7 TaxID=251699 RepID=UPI00376F7113